MNKKTSICKYLYQYHKGKRNAIHSRQLEQLFSIDGRNLRRKISSLRKDGYPICRDDNGYYYAQTQQEIRETIQRLNSLANRITITRNGMLFSLATPPHNANTNKNTTFLSRGDVDAK